MQRTAGLITVLSAVTGCYSPTTTRSPAPIETPPAERTRTPHEYDVTLPAGYRIEIVARDLMFPNGIAFGNSGQLYVIESGATPRLVELDPATGAVAREIAIGGGEPWNGIDAQDGVIVIAEGGREQRGRILRIDAGTGEEHVLARDLPRLGDHHSSAPLIVGSWVYFGQGAQDSGPCSADERRVAGQMPCSGAVFRVRISGGEPELVAWGLRNPYGLTAASDGKIFLTENRGEALWRLEPGTWYSDSAEPIVRFASHSSADGLAISGSETFGHVGHAFVALLGEPTPVVGKVDLGTGRIEEFARSDAGTLPRLERPVAMRFHDDALYVVDLGVEAGTGRVWRITRD